MNTESVYSQRGRLLIMAYSINLEIQKAPFDLGTELLTHVPMVCTHLILPDVPLFCLNLI